MCEFILIQIDLVNKDQVLSILIIPSFVTVWGSIFYKRKLSVSQELNYLVMVNSIFLFNFSKLHDTVFKEVVEG